MRASALIRQEALAGGITVESRILAGSPARLTEIDQLEEYTRLRLLQTIDQKQQGARGTGQRPEDKPNRVSYSLSLW